MPKLRLKRFAANPAADPAPIALPFEKDGLAMARRAISAWPGYAPTPLRRLSDLAAELGLEAIIYKDESTRFGLGSFKPLGGAYAVSRLLAREITAATGETAPDLFSPRHAAIAKGLTVTAATDGNHGRSVAWGARMFGCRCVIFVCASVSEGRKDAIAAYGAEIREADGSYDDAVRLAAKTAQDEGWHVIPDTSDGEIIDAPRDVTQGYMLMADEALSHWPLAEPPSHVFLQAGVGGMAAASCARLWQAMGADKPVIVIVEPDQCACWYESLTAQKPVAVTGEIDSVMAGLACGEVSMVAWQVLHKGADFMLTLSDEAAPVMMRYLAGKGGDDRPVVAGESGIAGLAGAVAAAQDPAARAALGLGPNSRILVFGSEGATDPVTYQHIVGKTPQEVLD
ncbi:MAG: diaminopropionate ammonia-lyase [Hyphomicrobiales bacterium]|nr:MAG: diaminopropionate ammonia-lyase [Hyphomicrobiales bacterium]